MKVKDLKKYLEQVDDELDVLVQDEDLNFFTLDEDEIGEVTFQGACDENGILLPDGNDVKYDTKKFILNIV